MLQLFLNGSVCARLIRKCNSISLGSEYVRYVLCANQTFRMFHSFAAVARTGLTARLSQSVKKFVQDVESGKERRSRTVSAVRNCLARRSILLRNQMRA